MKKIVTHLDAHSILGDVKHGNHFTTKDGVKVKNLHQLAATLHHMSDTTFQHHVDDGKNDVRRWIYDIVRDEQLADTLSTTTSKKQMIAEIQSRLHHLHNVRHHRICPYNNHMTHGASTFMMGIVVGIVAGIIVAAV